MHRGVEVGLYLRPGQADDNFIAVAIGNLAGYRLQAERKEPLEWQVLRVVGSNGKHHYRLVLRHPERVLDIGFKAALERMLKELSDETVEELRRRFERAQAEGLTAVPLRTVAQEVDYWRDDFWNWLG